MSTTDESVRNGATFGEVLERRFRRRKLLRGMAMIPAAAFAASVNSARAATGSAPAAAGPPRGLNSGAPQARDFRLTFAPINPSQEDFVSVALGYRVGVLIRWGDPLFNDSLAFTPETLTAAAQERMFGYNNDWMGYFPLPSFDVKNPRQALLAVNHEYTNPELMFKNYPGLAQQTAAQTAVEMAAHGLTVVEIIRGSNGEWSYIPGSPYNRRITANSEFTVTGPAAGSRLLRTNADPTGTRVIGTANNCSGGFTPWGTLLSGEENFQDYFSNRNAITDQVILAAHTRYGLPAARGSYAWASHVDRFDLAKEPNEPFRYGWIIEFDPYDPRSVPKKRTAMGRFRHEGCATQVTPEGRVVFYMGDDERFEFVYKYVSNGRYNPFDRSQNERLLDEGVLYVAKYNEDGTGEWLPLIFGQAPLTPANGFADQPDVLVRTRFAATAVGATRMDRPEDMECNPVNGRVLSGSY